MKFKICVFVLCALFNMSQQFSISKMCNLKNEDNINNSVNKFRRNILYSTILLNTLNIKKAMLIHQHIQKNIYQKMIVFYLILKKNNKNYLKKLFHLYVL